MAASSVETNIALCKALGLDPSHVKAVTIRLKATDTPRVEVEYGRRYLLDRPDLPDAIARFDLVPVSESASLGQEWEEPVEP